MSINQDIWGKPKKSTLKVATSDAGKAEKSFWGKDNTPFTKGNILKNMKSTTLSDNKTTSKKVFKSMGF